jgi:hypothetical protein
MTSLQPTRVYGDMAIVRYERRQGKQERQFARGVVLRYITYYFHIMATNLRNERAPQKALLVRRSR